MLNNKTVAVIIPAYNEAKQIGVVIDTIPDFVDRIVIINDYSTDKTAEIVMGCIESDKREKLFIADLSKTNVETDRFSRADEAIRQLETKLNRFFNPAEIA